MKRILCLAIPIAIAAAPLSAQDFHLGAQVGVSFPNSMLSDYVQGKAGFTLGLSGLVDLGSGHVIRPRLDYGLFKNTNDGGETHQVKTLAVEADYLYYFSGKSEGFYLTAGIGAQNTKVEFDSSPYPPYSVRNSKTAFAWAAGAGWQFTNHLGTELRYTSSRPEYFSGNSFKADSVNLGLTFKF